jgi:hypothetical protein
LNKTQTLIEQNETMFYAANRAYLGISAVGIETTSMQSANQLPNGGIFRIALDLTNKGKTPAENINYSFQGGVVKCPVSSRDSGHFVEYPADRNIRELLPEQQPPITLRSDILLCPPEHFEAVRQKHAVFIFGVKLDYICLRNTPESFYTYYIWDFREKKFTFRNEWPAGYVPGPHSAYETDDASPLDT